MKPFITPELTSTGKKAFRYQCEGVECQDLGHQLEGRQLVAYGFPNGHALRAAWQLWFLFDSGLVLEFSSASTHAAGWQEVGSLNIELTRRPADVGAATTGKETEVELSPIGLIAAEKLIFEDDDVVVECGLVLLGRDGQEVVIAAGIPPGSVSVQASFAEGQPFEPQFALSACRRQRIWTARATGRPL